MQNSKIILRLFVILFLICSGDVLSQVYSWKQKSNYGGGEVYSPFSFSIGNKGYVGAGRAIPSINKNDFWEFESTNNVWTQKANFPGTGRYGACGFSIGNYGYAGVGWDPSPKKDFYRYDPTINVWNQVSDFGGSARYTSVAFGLGNKGYLGLGYSPCKSDFWQYDPALNAWTQIASLPGGGRQAASAVVSGNYAYVVFGACNSNLYSDLQRYDPILNSWVSLASFPGPERSSAFVFAIADSIFIGLGNNYLNNSGSFDIFSDFWKYEITSDSWIQLPDHPGGGRFEGASMSFNGNGYIGFGSDTTFNTHYRNDFWEYSPDTTSGITEQQNMLVTLSPNPVANELTVTVSGTGNFTNGDLLELYTVEGKRVASYALTGGTKIFKADVSSLAKGVYIYSLKQQNDAPATGRLIKM